MRLSKPRVRPQSKTFLSSRLETGSIWSSHARFSEKRFPRNLRKDLTWLMDLTKEGAEGWSNSVSMRRTWLWDRDFAAGMKKARKSSYRSKDDLQWGDRASATDAQIWCKLKQRGKPKLFFFNPETWPLTSPRLCVLIYSCCPRNNTWTTEINSPSVHLRYITTKLGRNVSHPDPPIAETYCSGGCRQCSEGPCLDTSNVIRAFFYKIDEQ